MCGETRSQSKLQELGFRDHPKCIFLSDLFGKKEGSHYTEGLVDSTSDTMYDAIFDTLVENWKRLDVLSSSLEKFVEWFTRYKSPVLKSSMLESEDVDWGPHLSHSQQMPVKV